LTEKLLQHGAEFPVVIHNKDLHVHQIYQQDAGSSSRKPGNVTILHKSQSCKRFNPVYAGISSFGSKQIPDVDTEAAVQHCPNRLCNPHCQLERMAFTDPAHWARNRVIAEWRQRHLYRYSSLGSKTW
jgi:hypothetical protein